MGWSLGKAEAPSGAWALVVRLVENVLPVVLPTHPVRVCWTLWTLALVLYMALDVPLLIAFESWRQIPVVFAIGWMASITMCVDIIINFRTAYSTDRGDIISSPCLIAMRYLRGYFWLDLLSALPIDEIVEAATSGEAHENAFWLGLLRYPRLFILLKQVTMLAPFKYGNLVAVARLLLIMLLITHWSACLWYYLSQQMLGWPWIFSIECQNWSDRDLYLMAFYRSFLLILGDRPVAYNNLERVFSICLLFVGACLYAVVMGSMTLLVSNMWSMASRHKQRASMVQDALRYTGAADHVRNKVDAYFDMMAQFDHPGSEGVAVLSELSTPLHAELLASVFEPALVKVQLFANCERPFVWRLAQKLRLSLYMPRDTIYALGSVGHEMFIIWRGGVVLAELDGCMVALLSDGDHFGELGLMVAATPRPHRAVAVQPTDTMVLSRWDLQDVMKDFPESAALVKWRARVPLEDHEIGPAVWMAAVTAAEEEPGDSSNCNSNYIKGHSGNGRMDLVGEGDSVQELPVRGSSAARSAVAARLHTVGLDEEDGAGSTSNPNETKDAAERAAVCDKTTPCGDDSQVTAADATGLGGRGLRRKVARRSAAARMPTAAPVAAAAARTAAKPEGSASSAAPGPVAEATGDGAPVQRKSPLTTTDDPALWPPDSPRSCTLSEESIFSALCATRTASRSAAIPPQLQDSHLLGRRRSADNQPTGSSHPKEQMSLREPHDRKLYDTDFRRSRAGATTEHHLCCLLRAAGESTAPHGRLMRGIQDAIAASGSRRPGNPAPAHTQTGEGPHMPDKGSAIQDCVPKAPKGESGTESREDAKAHLFLLPPQPFLGPDPLGDMGNELVGATDNGATTWRTNHPGRRAAASTCGDLTFLSDDELFRANEQPFDLAAVRRSLRSGPRSSIKRFSGSDAGLHTTDGCGSGGAERFVDEWMARQQGCSNPRCAQLERQLAHTRRQLEHTQAQVASMMKSPLTIPGVLAAFQAEVSAVAARLSAGMDAVLQRVMEMLLGMEVRSEDLAQQVSLADERLKLLEEEHCGLEGVSALDVAAAVLRGSGRNARLEGLDPDKHYPTTASPLEQLTLHPPLSPVLGGGSVGPGSGDSSRRLAVGLGQPSLRWQHRQLSALEVLKALSEADSAGEAATGPAGGAEASSTGDAVLTRSASLLNAPVGNGPAGKERFSNKTIPRRRSALDLSVLAAKVNKVATAAVCQPPSQLQLRRSASQRHSRSAVDSSSQLADSVGLSRVGSSRETSQHEVEETSVTFERRRAEGDKSGSRKSRAESAPGGVTAKAVAAVAISGAVEPSPQAQMSWADEITPVLPYEPTRSITTRVPVTSTRPGGNECISNPYRRSGGINSGSSKQNLSGSMQGKPANTRTT